MKKFLESVAADLYSKFGDNLSEIAVVFPNKRAKNFFNNYLYNEAEKTLWSPNYLTIRNLVENTAELSIADNFQLVSELYEVYAKHTKTTENFNDFYFWGELLIRDFDDIDKNMVDANQLFQNLQNLKKMQQTFDFLDESQHNAMEQFFANFSAEKQSDLKKKFVAIWDVLGNIYKEFRDKLQSQNLAYEGMLFRSMIEDKNLNINKLFGNKKYVFVGFNVLNACEKELFYLLKRHEKALFYWDYDEYYLQNKNHEAGFFMRENLRAFPNELSPENFNTFNNSNKRIKLISSPTENAQARYLHEWTQNLQNTQDAAVVLCNESLLLPILYSLPENINDVNITMGFPLSQTPVYNAISVLIDLQTKGFDKSKKEWVKSYVVKVLQNQYIQTFSPSINILKDKLLNNNNYLCSSEIFCCDKIVELIFRQVENAADFINYLIEILKTISEKNSTDSQLYNEAIFRAYTSLNRLLDLVSNKKLTLELKTIALLLKRLLSSISVPFAGEPTKGLQIMGILETRNLDFKNILIMSANENILPKSENEASFIPYNLRRAFGLTTFDKRNSIYAFYFYRFLQRAENITISYCSATKGLSKGEMSRFVLQLLVESNFEIETFDVQSQIKLPVTHEIKIEKTHEIVEYLKNKYTNSDSRLSPRALNMFIDCSLKFYFTYIAKLNLPSNNADSDNALFGKIFHKTAEIIYKKINKFENSYITSYDLDTFIDNGELLKNIVDEAMQIEANIANTSSYSTQQLIMRDVIADYTKKLLEFDKQNVPFILCKIETNIVENFSFETPLGNVAINLGGRVDRIDIKENVLRITDYKTGGTSKSIKSLEELFASSKNRNSYAFQALLYSIIIAKQNPQSGVMPLILYINKKLNELEDVKITFEKEKLNDIRQIEHEFFNCLNEVISNIFALDKPFAQTENTDVCTYCDFKQICRR